MRRLNGKIALVTGGSRGIGAGIVRKLSKEGAIVVFTYLSAMDKAMALQNEIKANGGTCLGIQADTADHQSMNRVAEYIVNNYGTINILVNNAGKFVTGAIDDINKDDVAIARMWDINVKGVASTIKLVASIMNEGDRIISIGSGAADRSPFSGISDYSAGKAALAAYTRGWARDLAGRKITVNIIQPGLIDTDLKPNDEAGILNMLKPVALKRFGTPEEIGNVVAFLASDEASYITGATIDVDGGLSA